jgi:hypothetical protein
MSGRRLAAVSNTSEKRTPPAIRKQVGFHTSAEKQFLGCAITAESGRKLRRIT